MNLFPFSAARTKACILEPEPAVDPDDPFPEWREYRAERAAVRESDGGQAREHAEAEALRETLTTMRKAA